MSARGDGGGRRRGGWTAALRAAVGLAAAALAAAPALAGYDEGVAAYRRGDYQGAWLELGPLAESGDPRAQSVIGQMYAQGLGTRPDRVQALKWLGLAAAGGAPEAAGWREEVAREASPAEQAEAGRLAAEWRPQAAGAPVPAPMSLSPLPPAGAPAGQPGPSWSPPWAPPPSPAAAPEPGPGGLLNPAEIVELQRALAARGYYGGPADGRVGPGTQAAIRRYQADIGWPVDGLPTAALLDQLRATQPPPAAATGPGGPDTYAATDGPSAGGRTRPLGHVEGAMPDMSFAFIQEVQSELMKHGFNPGPVDGLLGWQTRRAIRRYQARAGLPVDGEVTLELLNHLKFARPPVYAD